MPVLAAEQVHGVDAGRPGCPGSASRRRRSSALRSRSQSAALWSRPGYCVVYSGVPPKRSAAPVRSRSTSPSTQVDGRLGERALEVLRGDVLARRDARDVEARPLAAELREVHLVDRRRARARVEVAERVDVRRPVVAERDPEALVGEVAVEVRRGVLEAVVLPHLRLEVAGVHRHALVDLLRQIDQRTHRRPSRGGPARGLAARPAYVFTTISITPPGPRVKPRREQTSVTTRSSRRRRAGPCR